MYKPIIGSKAMVKKLSYEQVEELEDELDGLPTITGMILEDLRVLSLVDIPHYLFIPTLTRIRTIKFHLKLYPRNKVTNHREQDYGTDNQ